jgi:hypothetical protein
MIVEADGAKRRVPIPRVKAVQRWPKVFLLRE